MVVAFVVLVVVVVVAGTTNCIWLCASLASSDCSRPFSILTINYQKKKTKQRGWKVGKGATPDNDSMNIRAKAVQYAEICLLLL